jgi:hypothetical protein
MLGKPVPDFSLPSTGGILFQLSPLSRDGGKAFGRANCVVISRDSHERFRQNMKQVRGIPKRIARGEGNRPRPGGIELC